MPNCDAGIITAVKQFSPKIVFLTSPNNPDGSLIQEEELKAILQLPVLVVLDEAYIEFADEPSRIKWVQTYDNLVVLRTFSKSAALAGIRVGYGSFPLGMIDFLWRAKQPYNVSVASEVAACAALGNMTYLQVCSAYTTPYLVACTCGVAMLYNKNARHASVVRLIACTVKLGQHKHAADAGCAGEACKRKRTHDVRVVRHTIPAPFSIQCQLYPV